MKPILFAVLLGAASLVAQPPKPSNPLGDAPAIAESGRLLYNRSCTSCHGPDGGEGARGPALDFAGRRYFRVSEAAIFDVIKNGIPGTAMPASGLADNDAWRVVAFIRNIRSTASDLVVPGDAQNGMAVFTGVGGCSRCHMIRGQGGVLGPDLSSIGAQASLNRLRDALTKERSIPNGYRPVTVTTLKGEIFTGVARNSDAFSLQLLEESSKLRLFDLSEVRSAVFSKQSLMPHGYDKSLTKTQFQDLLAMLSRQTRTKVKATLQGENEVGR